MTSNISNDVKSPINAPSAGPFKQRQRALEYIKRGWWILPVTLAGETPVALKQPRSRIGPDNIDQFIPDDQTHIGVATGHASGGLVVVRLPDKDARNLARHYLPKTGMKFGSPSARGECWVYEINESGADLSSQEWAVSGMGTLAELHGNGGITAFPDFINASGEPVTFEEHGVPQNFANFIHLYESDSECLRKCIINLCVATVMCKKWKSCDHLPLVEGMFKFLLVKGWQDLQIENVVAIAAENCGVEADIEGCFKSIASAGRSGLINWLGDDAVRDIEGWRSLRWIPLERSSKE
jgi:bifunctional DNA primase/polymerase-like protein